MGIQALPRQYRVHGRKMASVLAVFGVAVLGFLVGIWAAEDPVTHQVKVLVSLVTLLFFAAVAGTLPRTGTTVDRSGIQIRGPLRTRRLAWEEIQDITTRPLTSTSSVIPDTVVYADLTDGRRKLLIHLNDLHVTDFDDEIAILQTVCRELGGTDPSHPAPTP
ncbi:PH domain-containing protein [Streptomyces sp. NPDC058655]|uniref:PH domain-containing protein n=1 Tax=Streptomyces sp. NPDC058655 TaxID=3346577 RepID=UPI00366222B5